ncbi:MAG TPA: methyl-accepting chemotaxis protein, partial [Gemmatimonadales bacterium]|nr:methyl-accepting chemotaxis protein [Gemmatimonadales bacterium]
MAIDPQSTSSASSLSRRIVIWIGVALFVLLAGMAWGGSRLIKDRVMRGADAGVLQAAEQAAIMVDGVLAERERQVQLLASLPGVVDAAALGAAQAGRLGLVGQPIATLEQRFDATRTLDVDPRTRRFLLDRAASLDLAEVLVTDIHGFNVITTERTSDFVQSDEGWWTQARDSGRTPASAAYDESARRVSISVASAVRQSDSAPSVGVMKVVYGLAALQKAVRAAGSAGLILVEVIDSAGRVIVSSGRPADLKPLPGADGVPRNQTPTAIRYNDGTVQRASVRHTNRRTWRVVAHSAEQIAVTELRKSELALGMAGGTVFLLLLGALAAVNSFMSRRIAQPAAELAAAAESVAAGDLSVRLAPSIADDEIGRLGRATSAMIGGLRNLTVAIKTTASETADMALDLTASSEEMTASSEQMAQTSTELSQQSAEMAQTILEMAADSTRMVELSTALTAGAGEGVKRNQRLRALSRENRERLDASARELESLVHEVKSSAAAAEALAAASEEIREFVELVQRMARQSKLLAFSAAVEASRAGQEGAGFAVVAKEVERLATTSSEAAERTERVVTALLARVEESRESSARSALAVESVRKTTDHGLESFGLVEAAVGETEAWTAAIEQAAQTSSSVVEHTTKRL